ncbi:MAG TPA: hypothetical protein VHQ87_07275 [Rhizobacter sp.]|jgi:hypothetical protein|nr:hypothetical protein [Rhizobacter sp.]
MRPTLAAAGALLAGLALGRFSVPAADAPPADPLAVAASAAPREPLLAPINLAQVQCEARADDAGSTKEASPADERTATLNAALDTLARTSDPQRKTALIREIAAQKAQDDLGSAWTWLTQYRGDPGYAENMRNLLYQWSYARPEHVAALLPQVQSGEAQAAAAQQLAQLWNKKDPNAYHAWVASLPDGALKTAAGAPY